MKVKFKKLKPNAEIPKKQSKEAACVDLVICSVDHLNSNKAVVYLGFSTEIPPGYKAVIVPRSSFTTKGWVMQNSPAQIDSDYRGEWMLKFQAIPKDVHMHTNIRETVEVELSYPRFPYEKGERVAQMYLEKIVDYEIEEVEELATTERGEGGFGSTGK